MLIHEIKASREAYWWNVADVAISSFEGKETQRKVNDTITDSILSVGIQYRSF